MKNALAHPFRRHQRGAIVLAAAGFAFVATNAHAEWYLVARDQNVRVYVDNQLIQRQGDRAQMLQITDFVIAQWADAQTAIGSLKTLIEYDCRQPRSRALSVTAYSEQMGEGKLVATEKLADPPWMDNALGTTAEKLRQIACGK